MSLPWSKLPAAYQLHKSVQYRATSANVPPQHRYQTTSGVQCTPRHVWCQSNSGGDPQPLQPESDQHVDCSGTQCQEGYEVPEALRGLSINDQGLLVDEKSGKVINEMGATRFDVAVSAMRGLLDPPAWIENSEQTPGLILGSLFQFPRKHVFSVVGQNSDEFKADVMNTIQRVCQTVLDQDMDVRAVERLNGKFISLQIEAMVRAPEIVTMVFEELKKDGRVKMAY